MSLSIVIPAYMPESFILAHARNHQSPYGHLIEIEQSSSRMRGTIISRHVIPSGASKGEVEGSGKILKESSKKRHADGVFTNAKAH